MDLEPCFHRTFVESRVHCTHPGLIIPTEDGLISPSVCEQCKMIGKENLSLTTPSTTYIPPIPRSSSVVCGITTSYRKSPTLLSTIESVVAAGFSPNIYAERGTQNLGKLLDWMKVSVRNAEPSAWNNWREAAHDLVKEAEQDGKTCIVIFQDDVKLSSDSCRKVEEFSWPEDCGAISLYRSSKYQDEDLGWKIVEYGNLFWGALAFGFKTEILKKLLKTDFISRREADKKIDYAIGHAIKKVLGKKIYVANPSLVQHTGVTSTLFPRAGVGGVRSAERINGEGVHLGSYPVHDYARLRRTPRWHLFLSRQTYKLKNQTIAILVKSPAEFQLLKKRLTKHTVTAGIRTGNIQVLVEPTQEEFNQAESTITYIVTKTTKDLPLVEQVIDKDYTITYIYKKP